KPICICVVCPIHSCKQQKTQDSNNTEQTPPISMADVEMTKQKVDSHQLAVDKLTYALNMIKIETQQESDPTIKQKLDKYASLLKTQLTEVITT
uniref:Uncharacterized protein n=1 Tax=Romanomermis culicivorax TaxID=13658 RepID=A0A915HSM7_ROMCU